jgi:hypothetical protein
MTNPNPAPEQGRTDAQVELDAQMRWLPFQLERLLDPLAARLHLAAAALDARERAHLVIAEETLDAIDRERPVRVEATAEQIAHRAEELLRARDVVIDPEQDQRLLADPVTDMHMATAPFARAREVLVDLAATERALRQIRDMPLGQSAHDAAGLYAEYRYSHGRDHEQARAEAWLEVVEGTRGVFSVARDEIQARVDDLTEQIARDTLTFDARSAVQARVAAHEYAADCVLDRIQAEVVGGADEGAAAETAAREVAALVERGDAEATFERDLWAFGRGRPVVSEGREARLLAVPISPADIAAAPNAAEQEWLFDVAAAQGAVRGLRERPYAATVHKAAQLYVEGRSRWEYEPSWARAYVEAELSEGNHEVIDTARRQLTHQVEQIAAGPLQDALAELANVFGDSMTARDVGGHVTCTEADAVARALLLGGHRLAASRWLAGHARGDDDEADRHFGDSFDVHAYLDGLDPRHANTPAPIDLAGRVEDWAATVDTIDERIAESPGWPRLNAALHTAAGNGWAVATELPVLAAASPLPDHDPAGELYYRLLNSGATEVTADSGTGAGQQPPRPVEPPSYTSDAPRAPSPGI